MIAQMSEELVWSQIVARAWDDEDFMEQLLSGPRAVLAEYDLDVSPETEVEVVIGPEVTIDDTGMVRRFILTARPAHEVTDEDLIRGPVSWCACGACGRCGACGCRCRC
jgi:hypothetical protein